ncbi:succinate dehydrogenase cytochrome b subunit [Puia dinghuensis]|uniref:Fumarate reductase n=1 Tax=Puia dinghuensis TaxID=1792502 RepID=A0A8J2U6Y2_9BACT|nr:succinate dehydrogenase cytochrome b subunit [Puia dinghuensis]GGA82501.1 fumarate reductase [Puia dinghuensis]
MKWSELFTSSVGKKFVMGLTGVFLIGFLVVHVGINACIWAMDDGQMFNRAAHFMGATVVIRILEVGLFAGIFLHFIQGLMLEFQNRKKRAIGYQIPMANRGSKWYSRSMGLLGTIILIFLIIHWKQFWIPSRFTELPDVTYDNGNPAPVHDLFGLMKETFSHGWVVIVYVIACISLAYHLLHGFQSAFRSLGVYNSRYLVLINGVGIGFSIIVPLAFAMMPVSMYFNWV